MTTIQNKHIAIVPLDDRPCCYKFPRRIGEIAGYTVTHPPIEHLGNFTTPGDCQAVKEWIREHAGSASGLVISIDQLAYGGLVASRTTERTLEQCLETLSVIPEIKKAYPHLKIFAASVLMRLSITYKNKEYYDYGMMIFKYSQLFDRVHRLGESQLQGELDRLKEAIPGPVLDEYLEARKRNHAVNKLMLEWCAQGIIDYVTITQEDASPIGMHLSEQRILMERIYDLGIQHQAMVYPGADEAVQTMVIRMIQQMEGRQAKVYPRYASTAGRMAVADFEDRPVEETVVCHILAAGAVCVETVEEADFVLFVNTPLPDTRPKAEKAYFNSRHNYWSVLEGIKYELSRGRLVALADVAICNASDLELVQYVLQEHIYFRLLAYAGWNTAGNTMGTVLGHAIARWMSGNTQPSSVNERMAGGEARADGMLTAQERAHQVFMLERLMDEWAYQAQVRGEINDWIAAELDVNVNDLEHRYDEVNERAKTLMAVKFKQLKNALFDEALGGPADGGPLQNSRLKHVGLPWNRTFEIDVDIEVE